MNALNPSERSALAKRAAQAQWATTEKSEETPPTDPEEQPPEALTIRISDGEFHVPFLRRAG
jgi:hypothetical protein